MSTESVGWRRRLLGPPKGERAQTWPQYVAIAVAVVVVVVLSAALKHEGVAEWLAIVVSLGWAVPIYLGCMALFGKRAA